MDEAVATSPATIAVAMPPAHSLVASTSGRKELSSSVSVTWVSMTNLLNAGAVAAAAAGYVPFLIR